MCDVYERAITNGAFLSNMSLSKYQVRWVAWLSVGVVWLVMTTAC